MSCLLWTCFCPKAFAFIMCTFWLINPQEVIARLFFNVCIYFKFIAWHCPEHLLSCDALCLFPSPCSFVELSNRLILLPFFLQRGWSAVGDWIKVCVCLSPPYYTRTPSPLQAALPEPLLCLQEGSWIVSSCFVKEIFFHCLAQRCLWEENWCGFVNFCAEEVILMAMGLHAIILLCGVVAGASGSK